jgi:hypothetical protein
MLHKCDKLIARLVTAGLELANTTNEVFFGHSPKKIEINYIPSEQSVYVLNWNKPF